MYYDHENKYDFYKSDSNKQVDTVMGYKNNNLGLIN